MENSREQRAEPLWNTAKSYLSSFLNLQTLKYSHITFGQPTLFTFSCLPFTQSQYIICVLNFRRLPNLQCCETTVYYRPFFVSNCWYTQLLDGILSELAHHCTIFVVRSISFGVAKRNLLMHMHLFCAWNDQTASWGVPVSLLFVTWCQYSLANRCLICFWCLLPHWGVEDGTF